MCPCSCGIELQLTLCKAAAGDDDAQLHNTSALQRCFAVTNVKVVNPPFVVLQEASMLPEAFGSISVANTEPFNLSSFALSLLLVRCMSPEG